MREATYGPPSSIYHSYNRGMTSVALLSQSYQEMDFIPCDKDVLLLSKPKRILEH